MLERRSMEADAAAIAAFYGTRTGAVARRAVLASLTALWPDLAGRRLLGFGFTTPYLAAFGAERAIAAATAAMTGPPGCASLVCDEDALPFADALFDRVLIVHGLERADALRPLLRQLWRVLAPEGLLLVVVPNRASLWAQVERTPFGRGRPFSRGELDQILRAAMFEPSRWARALYAPPLATAMVAGSGAGWERAGALLFPALGAVHVVEAKKSIYAMTPLSLAQGSLVQAPQAAPLLSPDFSRPA